MDSNTKVRATAQINDIYGIANKLYDLAAGHGSSLQLPGKRKTGGYIQISAGGANKFCALEGTQGRWYQKVTSAINSGHDALDMTLQRLHDYYGISDGDGYFGLKGSFPGLMLAPI